MSYQAKNLVCITIPAILKKLLFFFMLLLAVGCKEKFNPVVVATATNYLVVEGLINSGQGTTNIHLSRTTKLADTTVLKPELGAQVMVEGDDNMQYLLSEKGAGVYAAGPLTLNSNNKYRLRIHTSNGKDYISDFVPVKPSPPIDSVSWKKGNNEVLISVNTHDPQNNTKYYRWDYEETWEYHSFLNSHLEYRNGLLYTRDSTNQISKCWRIVNSPDVAIGSSTSLSEDVISQHLLVHIENGSQKTSIRYSILVKQSALTKEAFNFWTLLRKNTQQLGGIFDAQPSEITGNIHCLTNAKEVVIGFVSVGAVTEKRILIGWKEDLAPWEQAPPPHDCELSLVRPQQDLIDYYFGTYALLHTPY